MPNKELKTMEFALISVPTELLYDAGICEGKLLQMSVADGKLVIEPINDLSDFVCGGDCENCPINEIDCDGDCENCPCADECDESEVK